MAKDITDVYLARPRRERSPRTYWEFQQAREEVRERDRQQANLKRQIEEWAGEVKGFGDDIEIPSEKLDEYDEFMWLRKLPRA